jgi:phage regulator Rha-like protein
MPDPLKFVDQKNMAVDLKNSVKNWERKIEIAEVAGKKARTILRSNGEHVDDIVKPRFLVPGGAIQSEDEGGDNNHGGEMDEEEEEYDN